MIVIFSREKFFSKKLVIVKKLHNFAAQYGTHRAFKRESGENPEQSRCGKFHKGTDNNNHCDTFTGRCRKTRNESEDLPYVHFFINEMILTRMRKHFILSGFRPSHILLAAASFLTLPVFGASVENGDTLVHNLGEVTVKGRELKKLKSTAPVYSVDNAKFESMGVTGVADALNRLPGVTLKDYGGAGGLKTVSVRGFGATHTNVLYDGIALSDCQTGEVDLSRYSLDNISSINLTVGDNDDIFIPARSASLAATLSLSTLPVVSDVDSTILTARLRGGSFGMVNPFLKVGRSTESGKSFDFSGEYLYGKNDYPFTIVNGNEVTRHRRNNSRMNSFHLESNGSVRLASRTTLNGKLYYYDNNRQLPGPVILYNEISNERLHDRNFFGQANMRSALSSAVSLLANAKFNWNESRYSDRDGKYQGGELIQNYYQREYYLSGAAMWLPSTSWSLVYAADYTYNNLNSNLERNQHPRRSSLLQTVTARYRLARLTVTGRALMSCYFNGVKSGEKPENSSKLSPSISVAYSVLHDRSLTFRASYKNIFRMPTFNELYYDHVGTVDLLPESTDQFNLGTTYSVSGAGALSSLYVTADGYINHVKDKIMAIPVSMFMWRMMNLGRVRSVGVDVTMGMTFDIKRGWQILTDGNYSLQSTTTRGDREASAYGKQIAYTPVHSGSVSVACENPFVNLVVHGTAAGERFSTNNHASGTSMDGYFEAGAAVYRVFPVKTHRLEVRVDLINMFDTRYEIIARYPMPGRSWQASVKFTL